MKKTSFFLIVCLLALVVLTANAQQGGFSGSQDGQGAQAGGFTGQRHVLTVQQALGLRDDTPVVLQGRIIRALGNNRYLFTDDTGTITLEIERRAWGSLLVDENDLVEVSGEIDREWNRVEVEVNRIQKL